MTTHDDTGHPQTRYIAIWALLMAIFAVSLAAGSLHLERHTVVTILFGAALVKAWLVLRNFMHLRGVTPWLYAIVGVPLLLAIFMVIAFVPDIGLYVWRGPLDAPAVADHVAH